MRKTYLKLKKNVMECKMDFSQVNLKIGNTNMLRNEAFITSDLARACGEQLPVLGAKAGC